MLSSGLWIDLLLIAILVATFVLLYRLSPARPALAEGTAEFRFPGSYVPALTRQAGFDPEASRWYYWLAKICLAGFLPLLFLEIVPRVAANPPIVGLAVLAIFGFLVPDLWLLLRRRERRNKIRRGLSYFLDLMVALLHSGLSLEEAFRRAGRAGFHRSHPLAREVSLVSAELDAGKDRTEAFRSLARRTGVSELKALAASLEIAARHGSSVEKSLETQADLLRTKRRENARKQVTTAATKAILPVMMCGLPIFGVLVFFPTVLEMMDSFKLISAMLR